jgi:hypothetical protein
VDAGGPYRSGGERLPRYVCIVCWKTLSTMPGLCPPCGVDRLDLDDDEVREAVRAEAEKRLERRMAREVTAIGAITAALVAPVIPFAGIAGFALAGPLAALATRLYTARRRGSALAVYAARRRRLAAEIAPAVGGITGAAPIATRAADDPVDPATLDLYALLRWLGATLAD